MYRAVWISPALAAPIFTLAFAAAADAAAAGAKYSPQLERAVIEEIQSRRHRAEPEDLRRIAWPEWRESARRCSSSPQLDRVYRGLVEDQICSPVAEDVKKILWALLVELRRTFLGGDPIQDAVDRLEGSAAFTDVPDAAFKCVAKLVVRMGPEVLGVYLPRAVAERLLSDPMTQRHLDRLIDKVFDLKSLWDFFDNLKKFWQGGLQELGDSAIEQQGEAWDMTKAPNDAGGWLSGFGELFESTHFTKMIGLRKRLEEAASLLNACRLADAKSAYERLLEESRRYAQEARGNVVWAEQEVYCAAPAATGEAAVSARELVARSGKETVLAEARDFHREVVDWHAAASRDPRLSAARFAAQRDKVKELSAMGARLRALTASLDREAACPGGKADEIRRLLVGLRDGCLAEAETRSSEPVRIAPILARLDQLAAGFQEFSAAMERGHADVDSALAGCRFGQALDGFSGALASFDRAHASQSLSSSTYRPCLQPWPGDSLEAKIRERGQEIAAAERAAEAALERGRRSLTSCDFALAARELDAAASELGGAGCPLAAPSENCSRDPEICGLARLAARVGGLREELAAKQARVGSAAAEREVARREAVASLGSLVAQAESHDPGRCAALRQARAELGALRSLAAGPPECSALEDASLTALAGEYEQRLATAERLGLDDLQRLRDEAQVAVDGCDPERLAVLAAGFDTLPEICAADANAARRAVSELQRELVDDVRRLGERLGGVEREWGEAWNACDMGRLSELGNSVAVLAQHPCVARTLPPEARTRLDALRQMSVAVPGVAQRKAALDARVNAKLAVAEGYVRLVESGAPGVNTAAAAAGLRRKLDEAEAVLREVEGMADASLPAMCFDPWREQLEDMRARIAAARSRIHVVPAPAGDDGSIVEPERPGGEAPPEERAEPAAGGGWDEAMGGAKRTSESGAGSGSSGAAPPPLEPSSDIEAILAAAADAYAACDFAGAQAMLGSARAIAPLEPRIARLSGLIAAQQQAAALYNAAISAGSAGEALGLLAQADAASGAAATSPPCLKARIADARTRGTAARTRDQAAADEQRSRDAWRGVAAGLLGTLIPIYNAGVRAGGGASPGLDSPIDGGAAGGAAAGGAGGAKNYCHIQPMPRSAGEGAAVTLLLVRQTNANLVQYAVIEVPADDADLHAAQWAGSGFSVLARYSSYDTAHAEAHRRCPSSVVPPAF